MIIQKGAKLWYWKGNGPAVQVTITKVASTGAGNSFAAVHGTTLNLSNGARSVPFVQGTPAPEQIAAGFCSSRAYVPPPLPLNFDQAMVQVRLGKTAARPGVQITPADLAAVDWVVR